MSISKRKTVSKKKAPAIDTRQLLLNFSKAMDNLALMVHEHIIKKENRLPDKAIDYPEELSWPKFIVYNKPLNIYTTIVARNIHHACNKATKDLHGNFTGLLIQHSAGSFLHYRFVSVAEFNRLNKLD
jgi:hypothetical protein